MRFTKYLKDAFIAQVMEDVPSVDYETKTQDLFNKLVKEFQKAAGVFGTEPERLDNRAANVAGKYFWARGLSNSEIKFIQNHEELIRLRDLYKEQRSKREELERKLEIALASCNTVKQAAERFPEFAKYLPKEEEPTKQLPAVANVLTDFVKAGWPKNQKKIPQHLKA